MATDETTMTKSTKTHIITLNFRGTVIQFKADLLNKLPNSSGFTGYLKSNYNLTLQELMKTNTEVVLINRSVTLFNHILDYLETDELHFPHCLCIDVILKELEFWGITACKLAECCMDRLLQHKEDKEMKSKISREWEKLSQEKKITHGVNDSVSRRSRSGFPKTNASWRNRKVINVSNGIEAQSNGVLQKQSMCDKLHEMLTSPGSCICSKIVTAVMVTVIVSSILILSLESCPVARRPSFEKVSTRYNQTDGTYKYYFRNSFPQNWIFWCDFVLTLILTLDLVFRLAMSDYKILFLKQWLTIVDILGILPVWMLLGFFVYYKINEIKPTSSLTYIYYIGLFRALRIFRFGHITLHSKKLRIVALALKHSWRELLIMFSLIAINSFVFGILVFHVELFSQDTFLTIFEGQWWAIVTMTTVGYGDFYPKSDVGRMVGVLCSLTGIVVVAMATSILVNNFLTVYKCVEKIERVVAIHSIKAKSKMKSDSGNTIMQ